MILELQVTLNSRDQAFDLLMGRLQNGECDRRFYGVSPYRNWVDLLGLYVRFASVSFH